MRRRGCLVAGALAVVLALTAAGCGGDDEGGGSASATTAAPETTGENELKLTAKGTAWDTTNLQLTSGTSYKLEVSNQDIDGGEDATISFTAPAAGSYQFICKYHPGAMKGTVTVT